LKVKTYQKIRKSAGKTIENLRFVDREGVALITFTDGSFSVIDVNVDFKAGAASLIDGDAMMVLQDGRFVTQAAVELGILTPSEAYQHKTKRKAELANGKTCCKFPKK
jgi:hypothetical protein